MTLSSLLSIHSTTDSEKKVCALCHQPVAINGFVLLKKSKLKHFCCEGCLSIYQLFNKNISRPNS
ncbi:MAG: metal-binding protein [Methylococcales bacterium]|nr:metal-binding protein [Methylococcales bacterium]